MPGYTLRTVRNWNMPTVSKGRDTRALVPRGRHGNRGSLTFSFPKKLGDSLLAKFANGQPYCHLKMERQGDHFLLKASKLGEFGRKFTLSNAMGRDYRVFFDAAIYKWIDEIEPFAATETTAQITDGGVLVQMPSKDKRVPLPEIEYRQRRLHYERKSEPLPEPEEVRGIIPLEPQDTLYLVSVPPEKDGKFHMMLRFLKLEAIKE